MIWLVVLLILWIAATEFIFFKYAKNDYDFGDSFISKKLLSLATSFIIVFFSVGMPTIFAFAPRENGLESFGIIAYAWYYGIILAVLAFFGINYIIYKFAKKGDNNED